MKIKNNNIVCLLANTLFACLCRANEWSVELAVDPITDKAIFTAWTSGTEISCRYGSYLPKLAIRIEPTGYNAKSKQIISDSDVFIWCPAIKRDDPHTTVNMTIRFDSLPPEPDIWFGSDNSCALFCNAPQKTFSRISKSKRLVMRFAIEGLVNTTIFDLTGLPAKLQEIDNTYLQMIGKYQPPSKPICPKCKGKKEIIGWVTCRTCNGYGMRDSARCSSCAKSIKLGKIREKIPCPECSPKNTGITGYSNVPGAYKAQFDHVQNQIHATRLATAKALINDYYDASKKWKYSKRIPRKQ